MKKKFTDSVGRVILTSDGLLELLLDKRSVDGLLAEESGETLKYNQMSDTDKIILYTPELQNQTKEQYDEINSDIWFTPEEYQTINIEEWLLSKCNTNPQKDRVRKELNMYEERNLYPLLKHLIFLVDHFRKNNIVWGIGRGSSVASYILYLIGIHKVDSIRYNLDIEEFLR